jgi:hypothetical protein
MNAPPGEKVLVQVSKDQVGVGAGG